MRTVRLQFSEDGVTWFNLAPSGVEPSAVARYRRGGKSFLVVHFDELVEQMQLKAGENYTLRRVVQTARNGVARNSVRENRVTFIERRSVRLNLSDPWKCKYRFTVMKDDVGGCEDADG